MSKIFCAQKVMKALVHSPTKLGGKREIPLQRFFLLVPKKNIITTNLTMYI